MNVRLAERCRELWMGRSHVSGRMSDDPRGSATLRSQLVLFKSDKDKNKKRPREATEGGRGVLSEGLSQTSLHVKPTYWISILIVIAPDGPRGPGFTGHHQFHKTGCFWKQI